MPFGSGTRLRSSRPGDPIAPAAATKVRARTVTRRAVGAYSQRVHRRASQCGDPVTGVHEFLRPHARDERCAAVERVGNGGDEHRALGVDGTSHAAIAEVPAVLHVAPDRMRGDADAAGAARQRLVVGVWRHRPRADRQPRLHLGEIGREVGRRESGDAVSRRPPCQRWLGRAERARPVDGRAAADAAALQDVDRLVLGPPARRFLVELRVGIGLAHPEVARRLERALLEQHDGKPRRREDRGRGAAAGAGSDDGDVAGQFAVIGEARRVDDAPARGVRFAIGILDGGVERCAHESSGGPG